MSLLPRERLVSSGVHPRRLASAEFIRPLPGHYMRADAPAPLELIARTLCDTILPGAVISHQTAAELYGWPVPQRLSYADAGLLHCRLPPADRRSAGRSVHVHRRLVGPESRWARMPVSPPLEVLCDVAGAFGRIELVACIESAIGPYCPGPTLTLPQLVEQLAAASPQKGIAAVRAALPLVRENVESPKETVVRLMLIDAGFLEPAINVPIWTPGATFPFRLDLAYPEQKIAIEYDGDWHRTDQRRFQLDRRKDDVLHELGWRVVRVTVRDLREPRELFARLMHLGAPRR